MASSYNNIFRLSNDGGETWRSATNGIMGDGPFISRLSNSPDNPDLVFAVGDRGVYRHTNFCVGRYDWELIEIENGWAVNDQVTSSHNVEVSLADEGIVWAGAGMYKDPDLSVFLSRDYGKSFEAVGNFEEWEMGYLTSIATHPSDPATAYMLFSMNKRPKIVRTTDYGESWEDISEYSKVDSMSANGFPDVMIYSLLVFPYNTDIIWAGTEIGIYESTDNGDTWHYANNGLPAVSVWQMIIQDHTLVVATHGRGIWTAPQYPGAIDQTDLENDLILRAYPNPSDDIITLEVESPDFGEVTISIFTINGEKVYTEKSKKYENTFRKEIKLVRLRAGPYILSAELNGKKYSSKIVVQ
ncbi:hypothetical protein ES708_22061 [subsurface metagenome]